MDCRERAGSEMAENYVTGHLGGAEKEAFELHFFECPQCLAEVRALQLSKAVLEQDEALQREAPAPTAVRLQRFWWPALAAAASLAIVAIGLRLATRPESPQGAVAAAGNEPAATGRMSAESVVGSDAETTAEDAVVEVGQEANRDKLLASLAAVEPAPYERVVLRGVAGEAPRLFDQGMAAYVKGDFDSARGFLQAAAASDPGRPDIAFYYGVSLLLSGNSDEAIVELARAADLNDPVFSEEARFYLAKAFLGARALEEARRTLLQVVEGGGVFATEAARILQEMEALP